MQEICTVLTFLAALAYLGKRLWKKPGSTAPGCDKCAPVAKERV